MSDISSISIPPKIINIRSVVLGYKSSGKSALMVQLCDSYINENLEYERQISDPKLDFELRIQFTDRLPELPNAKACFIVIDLTSNESFEFAKNIAYPKAIKEMSKDSFVYLVGNKADLSEKIQVQNKDITQFANEKCIPYTEICCLSSKKKGIDIVQRMLKYRLTSIVKSERQNSISSLNMPKIEGKPAQIEVTQNKPLIKFSQTEQDLLESISPELPPRENSEVMELCLNNNTADLKNESNLLVFNPSEIEMQAPEQETKEENQILIDQMEKPKNTDVNNNNENTNTVNDGPKIEIVNIKEDYKSVKTISEKSQNDALSNGSENISQSDPTFSHYSTNSYQTNKTTNMTLNPLAPENNIPVIIPPVNTTIDPKAPLPIGIPKQTPQFQNTETSPVKENDIIPDKENIPCEIPELKEEENINPAFKTAKFCMNLCQPFKSPFHEKSNETNVEKLSEKTNELPVPEQIMKSRNLCRTPEICRSRNSLAQTKELLKTDRIEKDEDKFLNKLDEDLENSAKTLKIINNRYNRRTSPLVKKSKSNYENLTEEKQEIPQKHLSDALYSTNLENSKLPTKNTGILQESHKFIRNSNNLNENKEFPVKRNLEKFLCSKITSSNSKSKENARPTKSLENIEKVQAIISLEIMLAPDNIVNLQVGRNDTPTKLAKKCLEKGKIINYSEHTLIKLSEIIEQKVSDEISAVLENVKNSRIKIIQEKADAAIMSKNILKTPEKQIKYSNENQKIIGKLSIIVGDNQKGTIIIKDGESTEKIVTEFMQKYSMKEANYKQIYESVENLKAEYSEKIKSNQNKTRNNIPFSNENTMETLNEHSSLKSESSRMSVKSGCMFKVNFTLEDGRTIGVPVCEKDNLYRLARNFVVTYKLKEEMIGQVWESLQESYKVFLLSA